MPGLGHPGRDQTRPSGPVRDAKDIVDELTRREVKLSIGVSVHDPTEADLIRARTLKGLAVAKAEGRLRRKQPKLSTAELAELFAVARSTAYRAINPLGETQG